MVQHSVLHVVEELEELVGLKTEGKDSEQKNKLGADGGLGSSGCGWVS